MLTAKRWIALVCAFTLVIVSIGINSLSLLFSQDINDMFDKNFSFDPVLYEEIIEGNNTEERIAVLNVDGVIQDTGPASPFATPGYNHELFMNQLATLKEDKTVKGIVLRVNSPGGGVLESSDIYDEIISIQQEKSIPVYVSMEGMAASGGYYISAPADKIFVHPETITGSIGVIMESLNYSQLAEKLGIDFNTIKTGPYKDMMSPAREMTKEERAMLQEMINDSYERFVDIIAQGRNMKVKEVKKIADGRIMNGRQAIEAGLADDYGKVDEVIGHLKDDLKLSNPEVFEYTSEDSFSSFFGMSLSGLAKRNMETELIEKMLTDYQAPRMMYLYGER